MLITGGVCAVPFAIRPRLRYRHTGLLVPSLPVLGAGNGTVNTCFPTEASPSKVNSPIFSPSPIAAAGCIGGFAASAVHNSLAKPNPVHI